MQNTFKKIINESAFASSIFAKRIYEGAKDVLPEDLHGVKFETTITILDENDMPVFVTRATCECDSEKPAAPSLSSAAAESDSDIYTQRSIQSDAVAAPVINEPRVNTVYEEPVSIRAEEPSGVTVRPVWPAEPVARPAEPVIRPAEPVARPAEPVIRYAEPVARPAEPVIRATEPVSRPAEPAARPAMPMEGYETRQPEYAYESAAQSNDQSARNIPLTVNQPSYPAEKTLTEAEAGSDKRKKIESLLKKYSEIN